MTTAGRPEGHRLLLIGAAVAALLVLAIGTAIALIDVNRYKPEIEEAVRQHTGRTLQLKGDLALSIFPTLAVDFPASSLSARGSEAEFLSFASARVAVALLPLLRQKIHIESIHLRQARANVTLQRNDSRKPAETDVPPEKTIAPPAADTQRAPGSQRDSTAAGWQTSWEIGRLLLNDAAITLHDAASGKSITLSAINLKTGRLASKTRLPLTLSAQLAANTPELAGALELTATVNLDLDRSLLAASNLKLGFVGTLDKQALRTSITASHLSRQAEAISAAQVAVHADGVHAADAWTLAASLVRMSIDEQALSSGAIEANILLTGAQAFDARISLDRITGSKSSLLAENFLLLAARRDGRVKIQARVGGPLGANLETQTLALSQFDGEIAVEDPQMPEGQARLPLAGALTIDARQEHGKLELACSEADASFNATIDFRNFGQPEVGFDLQAARLNLDRYLRPGRPAKPNDPGSAAPAPARQAAARRLEKTGSQAGHIVPVSPLVAAPAPPAAAADQGFERSPWHKLRLDGELQIAQVQARGIKLAAVHASVHSAAGRTAVAPLSARLYSGKADGDLTLDAQDKRVSLRLSLNDVDLGAMARDALGRSDLGGRGHVELALSTAGRSRAERTRAATGTARFALRDVALVGIDLSAILDQLKAALTGGGIHSGKIDRSRRTQLSRLSGTIHLADGIARNDDLAGSAPRLELAGDGQFDLLSNNLDYTLRVAMTTDRRPDSMLMRALEGFPVPVHFSGSSDELRYAISLKNVAADALARYRIDASDALIEKAESFLDQLFGSGKKK